MDNTILAPSGNRFLSDFDHIPVVDLSPFYGDDKAAKRSCAEAVGRACREVGFFYIRNHKVEQRLLDDVFTVSREFFALPVPEKLKIDIATSPAFRGYVPLQAEVTDPALGADLKEAFDMALEPLPDDPDGLAPHSMQGPNQWPARPAAFRGTLQRYYDRLNDLGRVLSRAFALSLDLPESFFARNLERPTAMLRVLHYPQQAAHADEKVGCGAHSDYGYLTILAQDDVGGLQVQNRAGRWIDAPYIPGTFICNIGDLMAIWTNDQFAATKHRVLNRSGRDRYSIPFFFHPNSDTQISCLPSCCGDDDPPRYPPTTSGAWLYRRFSEAYA